MGLTSSLFTGLSGLNANTLWLNVTGNNIANANTNGFKASRATFETQVSRRLNAGRGPTETSGGTNPTQVGLGTRTGGVTRNFNNGSLQPTGVNTDLALEGKGFFIVEQDGNTRFTRAGNFVLDSDFNLVNLDGGLVQGFGVDENFQVVEGVLEDINIPVGVLTLAEATREVKFKGNLAADGEIADQGTIIESSAMFSDPAGTVAATSTDLLSGLFDASGVSLFNDGDVITVTNASKGGSLLPDKKFGVGAVSEPVDASGTTLGDFAAFMEDLFGIETSVAGGVSIDGSGQLRIEGNTGTANHLELPPGSIVVNRDTAPSIPFDTSSLQDAEGESVRTTFAAYDSLGTPLTLDLSVVLESKDNTGTTWRVYAQSEDDTDLDRALGTGLLKFSTSGELVSTSGTSFSIDRDGTGAATPQPIKLTFQDEFGAVSALADETSQITSFQRDGTPLGTLEDFTVQEDGVIVGAFSNSLLRNIGQVSLSMFANPEGLLEVGNNLYANTVNSGTPQITKPLTGGSGRVVGGALELSNVDLSAEFVNLISASTGFSANSRVVTTSERLIQELLQTVR